MNANRTILILGDGYLVGDAARFHLHASAVAQAILNTEPFASEGVSVVPYFVPSNERTVADQRLDTRYQLMVTSGNRIGAGEQTVNRVREDTASIPHRWVVILANTTRRVGRVGAGVAMVGGGHAHAPAITLHELGHLIGGLADEYGSHDRTHPEGQHGAPNFSTVGQPLKWAHLVDAGLLPTPTRKAGLWSNMYRPLPRSRMYDSLREYSPVDVAAIRQGIRAGRVHGDANCDGVVNFADLNTVLGNFGRVGDNIPGDLNGDGKVDMADLNEVLGNFGNAGDEN